MSSKKIGKKLLAFQDRTDFLISTTTENGFFIEMVTVKRKERTLMAASIAAAVKSTQCLSAVVWAFTLGTGKEVI